MLARSSVWSKVQVVCTLYMVQLTPLPLTVNCFSKIQIGFTFLVPAHPGSLGPRAVKRVCGVCVFALHNFRIILVLVFRLRAFAYLVMLTMRFFLSVLCYKSHVLHMCTYLSVLKPFTVCVAGTMINLSLPKLVT